MKSFKNGTHCDGCKFLVINDEGYFDKYICVFNSKEPILMSIPTGCIDYEKDGGEDA